MKLQMFRDVAAGDSGAGGAGDEKPYSNWSDPISGKTDDELLVERQEFIGTKTDEIWKSEAKEAGKELIDYQREAWNTKNISADPPEFTPNILWNDLKGIDGFTMPDNLTAETENELLKKALVDNKLAVAGEVKTPEQIAADKIITDKAAADKVAADKLALEKDTVVDPEVKAFLDWKVINPDKTMNDYMSDFSLDKDFLSLADREFMVEFYTREYGLYDAEKNPDGLTETQIDEAVNTLEENKQLPIEVRKIKSSIRTNQDSVNKAKLTENQKIIDKQQSENKTALETDINKLFVETEKITELNGVKVSKADVSSINEAFKKAVLPDAEGNVKIIDMLRSNDYLWKFFAVQYQGDSKFKEALFNAGDSTKDELIGKLGLRPIISGGRQSDLGTGRNVITPSKWAEPDTSEN